MGLIRAFTHLSPHLRLALIVAPLLALGGYLLAGRYAPRDTVGNPGAPRALQPETGCRVLGGVCRLLHRELAANLGAAAESATRLYLATSVPLKGGAVAVADHDPVRFSRRGDARHWQARLSHPLLPGQRLQLALVTDAHRYYAEVPVTTAPETPPGPRVFSDFLEPAAHGN